LKKSISRLEQLKYAEQIKKNAKIIKYSETDRKALLISKIRLISKRVRLLLNSTRLLKQQVKISYRNSKGRRLLSCFHIKGVRFVNG
jgi:hypothetical protein